MLPLEVLQRAGAEITNYGGSGMSVMEMSHRSKVFLKIFDETQEKFRRLLGVPEGYKVLFLQGGGTMQFGMIPLNLIGKTGKADYAVTGHFANLAMKEAKKYGTVNIAASSEDRKHVYIPTQDQLKVDGDASYFYYCSNNTIEGTQWQYVPETGSVPLACDMSSDILSRPVDVSKFGLIFAGAQKNLAPAGLTIVIIREDLAGSELPITPAIMNYKSMIDKDSMYNTPPCWCIYMLGLMCDWLEQQGGAAGMEKINVKKAQMLYDVLDASKLFTVSAEKGSRSFMNVTFRSPSDEMDAKFVAESVKAGFTNLKGHRSVGDVYKRQCPACGTCPPWSSPPPTASRCRPMWWSMTGALSPTPSAGSWTGGARSTTSTTAPRPSTAPPPRSSPCWTPRCASPPPTAGWTRSSWGTS